MAMQKCKAGCVCSDGKGTVYDMEMQVTDTKEIPKKDVLFTLEECQKNGGMSI